MPPGGPQYTFSALLDTGAQITGISRTVIETLRITPVGTIPIVHTNRTRQHHDAFWLPYRLPSGASSKSSAWLTTLVASRL